MSSTEHNWRKHLPDYTGSAIEYRGKQNIGLTCSTYIFRSALTLNERDNRIFESQGWIWGVSTVAAVPFWKFSGGNLHSFFWEPNCNVFSLFTLTIDNAGIGKHLRISYCMSKKSYRVPIWNWTKFFGQKYSIYHVEFFCDPFLLADFL